MSSKRPLSPHLTIYKPQLTSVLSITHRITGFALFVAALCFAWWVTLTVFGCAKCFNPLISSTFGTVTLIAVTAVLYYHLCNGIRHLFWDMGKGYAIKSVNRSGVIVILLTLILTGLTWCKTVLELIGGAA